jgi:YD repeat-containing protein
LGSRRPSDHEQFRLVAITDALGQVSTIAYDLASDPLKITGITDPFGREAVFTYNASGELESITDVIGLTSTFRYAGDDFITTLTTPYGTTSFRHEASALNSMYNTRFVEATDPLGGTEHMEFQYQTPSMSPTDTTSLVPTGAGPNVDLDHFNTFYWDKRAWKAGPGDLTKATLYHWFGHTEIDGWQEYSSTVHSVKRPLEHRAWYRDKRLVQILGADIYGHVYIIDEWLEDAASRLLDDGAQQEWYARFDLSGTPEYTTDPLGRMTRYAFNANLVDVLTIKQTNAANSFNDSLAAFGSYVYHRPQSATDAAGQTNAFTYNSASQLLTATNALGEILTYGYNTDGYLTSITGAISGATTSVSYDGYGRARTIVDRRS